MRLPEIMEHLKYLEKRIFKGHALWIPVQGMDEALHKQVLELLTLFEQKGAQIFFLSAGDAIAFFHNNKLPDMMLAALKIKALNKIFFSQHKIDFFNLSTDFTVLYSRIEKAEMMPPDVRTLKTFQQLPLSPIQAEDKQKLLNILITSDISHLIHHSFIYRQENDKLSLWKEEVFCPFTDVRKTLLTSFDLGKDWIFQNQLIWQIEKKLLKKYPADMAFPASLWRLVQAQEYNDISVFNTTFILQADTFISESFLFSYLRQNTHFADTHFILRLTTPVPLHFQALPFDAFIMPWNLAEQHKNLADKIIVSLDNITQYHTAVDQGFFLFCGKCINNCILKTEKILAK